jgi:hypothetical protein
MNKFFSNIEYLPFIKGKYDVSPNFNNLILNHNSDDYNNYLFHIDTNYHDYIDNKNNCRNDNISKYYQELNLSNDSRFKLNKFLINQLCLEYPTFFKLSDDFSLYCSLTKEQLIFNQDYELLNNTKYKNLFDALLSQIQEDIVIISFKNDIDYLSSIHLCSPSYWSAEQNIGKNFSEIHKPVAGMDKINKMYKSILKFIFKTGNLYRFAWEINSDNILNHHPDKLVFEKKFNASSPELFVRIERQCLIPLGIDTLIFTIKTYYKNVIDLNNEQTEALINSLKSMNIDTLKYKRIELNIDDIIYYLKNIKSKI